MSKERPSLSRTFGSETRSRIKYKGRMLSRFNQVSAWDAIRLYGMVLIDVLRVEVGSANMGRLVKGIKSLAQSDLYDVLSTLDSLSTLLVDSAADCQISIEEFKALLFQSKRSVKGFLEPLGGLIMPHLRQWFRSNDPESFRILRQCFEFLKRLSLRMKELEDPACQAWYLPEAIYPEPEVPDEIVKIAQEWFPIENTALIAEYFTPHHGSGAVYEGSLTMAEKYMLTATPRSIKHYLDALGWNIDTDCMQSYQVFPDTILRDSHRILFVPKSYKVYRGVSMEETVLQFFAEGAATAIFQYLKDRSLRCPLSAHYCVDTEGENRELCRKGSIDGSFATIDLSSASDSVSLACVDRVLGSTCLWPLLGLRSKYAQFPEREPYFGSKYEVRKFAPMGSALCFPIESIIFSLFTEYAVRHTPGASRNYRVYGDDIVVDSKAAPLLMCCLKEAGFTVNAAKSFWKSDTSCRGFFRESCGAEYLNGYDVAPVRLSRKFRGFSNEAELLPQFISLANDLYGLKTARASLIDLLVNEWGLPFLFDEDGSRGIKSPHPTNFHLDKRFNRDLQREEVFALSLRSQRRDLSVDGEIPLTDDHAQNVLGRFLGEVHLYEYLRLTNVTRRQHLLYPEDRVTCSVEPFSSELVATLGWVAKPDAGPLLVDSSRER